MTNLVCYRGHSYPVWDVDFGPEGICIFLWIYYFTRINGFGPLIPFKMMDSTLLRYFQPQDSTSQPQVTIEQLGCGRATMCTRCASLRVICLTLMYVPQFAVLQISNRDNVLNLYFVIIKLGCEIPPQFQLFGDRFLG
jgi:hypothetical protein